LLRSAQIRNNVSSVTSVSTSNKLGVKGCRESMSKMESSIVSLLNGSKKEQKDALLKNTEQTLQVKLNLTSAIADVKEGLKQVSELE